MNELSKEEKEKFEELYRTMYPKVKAFAVKILQSEDDAEDIAEDIFVKLLNDVHAWENPETRNSFIYTLTRNHIFNFLKHKAIEQKFQAEKEINLSDYYEESEIHNHLYAKELKLLVELTVRNMPEQRRKVFVMSRIQKKTHAEIAAELNISVRTVERHVYLALKELKKVITLFMILLSLSM